MRPTRRASLALLAAPLAAPFGAPRPTHAAETIWPLRPVRFIGAYAAGGPTDILSRLVCAKLAELTGQQFITENRTGAGGAVATEAIAKAPPDGYTVGMANIAPHAILPSINPSLPYDPGRDFSFVTGLWQMPNMLCVNPGVAARDIPDLIALMKASPGRFSFGSGGIGTSPHICGELFCRMAGVSAVHVPYRGSAPAMLEVIAGRLQFIVDNMPGAIAQTRAGTVRPLAVTSLTRSPLVPEVPTMAEFLPGFEMTAWGGWCGPAGLPPEVVGRMNALCHQALAAPDLARGYLELGATPWPTTPEALVRVRAEEEARLRPIIRASGAAD